MIKSNEFGEIYNCDENYREIAKDLKEGKSVIIQWISGDGLTFTILFCYNVKRYEGNYLQYGIKPDDLFVNIINYASYGFSIKNNLEIGYMQSKLGINDNYIGKKLNELINGIIYYLRGANNE